MTGRKSVLTGFAAIVIMVFAFAISAKAEMIKVGAVAPDFTYETQFDTKDGLKQNTGKVFVIMFGGKKAFETIIPVTNSVKEHYSIPVNKGTSSKLAVYPVGNMKGLPKFILNLIKKPDMPPCLIDFEGDFATKYGVSKDIPYIIIVSKNGKVAFTGILAGEKSPDGTVTEAQIIKTVDKLMAEKATPAKAPAPKSKSAPKK